MGERGCDTEDVEEKRNKRERNSWRMQQEEE